MKRLLLALGFVLGLGAAADAACPSPLTGKDAGGTTQNFSVTLDAAGSCEGNVASALQVSAGTTMQSAATGNGSGTAMPITVPGYALVDVICTVACSGGTTVTFEGNTVSNTAYAPVQGFPIGGGACGTTTITTGRWLVPTAGLANLEAIISGYSAGTITVTGYQVGGAAPGSCLAAAGNLALDTSLQQVVTNTGNPGQIFSFGALSNSAVTRVGNTTTYTANTGWCTLTSSCVTTFSFANACRVNGGQVIIQEIDIWSSANPTLKLQGILWLFAGVPGTILSDDATFAIASADFANLTGNHAGHAFTLANNQASSAANSSASLTGTSFQAQCASGTTTINGMVQVVNAYVPASAEILNISLRTLGVN